jgi:hypothetical protein
VTDKIRVVSESGDDYPTSAREAAPCAHEYISWHGSRPECQECGESPALDENQAMLDDWADGIYSTHRKDNDDG